MKIYLDMGFDFCWRIVLSRSVGLTVGIVVPLFLLPMSMSVAMAVVSSRETFL